MQTLSPPQRPVCVSWEERKRERAGHDGEGKARRAREARFFPSSHRPPRAFYFFRLHCIATFNRDTQREPLQRREVQTDNCQSEMVIEQLVDHPRPRRPRGSQSGRIKGRQN